MATNVDRYFAYDHLPSQQKVYAQPVAELASFMNDFLPDGPDKSEGMRKLLEAQDCFIRAALDKQV